MYRGKVNDEGVLLALYVDDGLLAAKSKQAVEIVLNNLKKEFKITVGKADCYVGLKISRNQQIKEIFVNQHAYLKKVIEKFGMKDCKESSVPAEARLGLSIKMSSINRRKNRKK